MVTQGIIELLLKLATPILSLLPNFSIATVQTVSANIAGSGWSLFIDFVHMALYFFPIDTLVTILDIMFVLMIVRCVIAFLKTLWGVLPIL